jgi:hypothetical protein
MAGTSVLQAALAAAEKALQTAIAAKNAADKSYTAAKQNAEKEAKKKQQQEAKRKQRAADAEVAGDVAAGVVAAYYAVPEFQGRANNNHDCWQKAAEKFKEYCETQVGWRTDYSPEQCRTIFTKERQLYIHAIRQFAQTQSGQEAPDMIPEKVADYHEAERPAFRIFHNQKVFESDDVIPPYTLSGAGPAEREIVVEDGKAPRVLLRAGGGVNRMGQKHRPRNRKGTKHAKSSSSSSSGTSDSEEDPLNTSTSTVNTSAEDQTPRSTKTHKKHSLMQEMLSEGDKRNAKTMKKVHDKGNKTLLELGDMLVNRKHAAPTAGTAVDSADLASKLLTSLGAARTQAREATDDAMQRNWEREANRLQTELDKLYS